MVVAAVTAAAWIGFFPAHGPDWLWPVVAIGMATLGWVSARWWSALVAAAIVMGGIAVAWWGPWNGGGGESTSACDPGCISPLGVLIFLAPLWAPLLAAAGVGLRRATSGAGRHRPS